MGWVNEDLGLIGSVVGERYLVRELLGHGVTGTVFGTAHVHLRRASAMKVLRPRYASIEAVHEALQGETLRALGVAHPSLCEVFDAGALPDGAAFLVMERLEGVSLASRLGRERFSGAAAVELGMQLLSAIAALHARNVLVRDLRPQNVFLAERRGCRPLVKLLDLGLAPLIPLEQVKAEWDALHASASASSGATTEVAEASAAGDVQAALSVPYYLSPERTRGELAVDASSDLFVAAVILYEALTGEKPFRASTWEGLVRQLTHGEATPLRALRPDLSEALAAVVMRALSVAPRARPASALEMQEELRRTAEGPGPPSVAPGLMPARALTAQTAAAIRALYEDDTRTDRKSIDLLVSPAPPAPTALPALDEASAEHPVRTLRPPRPSDIDIDIDLEHLPGAEDEDETATQNLSAEVRARIDELSSRTKPPPAR